MEMSELEFRIRKVLLLDWEKYTDEMPFDTLSSGCMHGKMRLFNGNDEYDILEYAKAPGVVMLPCWRVFKYPLDLLKWWYGVDFTDRADKRAAMENLEHILFHFQHTNGVSPFSIEYLPHESNDTWLLGTPECMLVSFVDIEAIKNWLAEGKWLVNTCAS